MTCRDGLAVVMLVWGVLGLGVSRGQAQDWSGAVQEGGDSDDYYVILHSPSSTPGGGTTISGGPLTLLGPDGQYVNLTTECININQFQSASGHDADMEAVNASLGANAGEITAVATRLDQYEDNTDVANESLQLSREALDQVDSNTALVEANARQVKQNEKLVKQNAKLTAANTETLEAHARILDQHSAAIASQSRTLSEHEAMLGSHESRLNALEGQVEDIARSMAQGIALLSSLDFQRPAPGKHVRFGLGGGMYEDEAAVSAGITMAVGAFDCGVGFGTANGQSLSKANVGWSF